MPVASATTVAFSPTTAVAALEATRHFTGARPKWHAADEQQQRFLEQYPRYANLESDLPELNAWAARTAEEINAILAEHNFGIRLNRWDDPDGFGVVGISDISVKWPEVRQVTRIYTDDGDFPAIKVPARGGRLGEEPDVSFWQVGHYPAPVMKLKTQSGDVVAVTEYPQIDNQTLMMGTIAAIRAAEQRQQVWYDNLIMPMVSIRTQPDISWLCGLNTDSPSGMWFVAQALQEVVFGLNQFGARSLETSAMAMTRGASRENNYEVNHPFLIWIERPGIPGEVPGIPVPIFQAYVAPNCWANPGDLDKLDNPS